MGMRMPETCWAVFKWQVINLRSCCIWLFDSVERVMNIVCIDNVTGLKVRSSNFSRDEIFFFFPKFPHLPWNPLCLQFRGSCFSSLGLNQPGRELNHSPPSSTEVNKEWSYTAIPLYVLREKLQFLNHYLIQCTCFNIYRRCSQDPYCWKLYTQRD